MADDFRIVVEFEEDRHGLHFGRRLGEREFEKEVREQLGDGVLVTRDGPHVFLYTATQEQAEAAEQAVQQVLAEDQMRANVSPVLRWHPAEERWEDASKPLPADQRGDRGRARALGGAAGGGGRGARYAEWEVRVDLPSHRDAVEFAERLEAEGITPITRRWKYVLIGTANDDDATGARRAAAGPRRREGATVTRRAERDDRVGAGERQPVLAVRRIRPATVAGGCRTALPNPDRMR